MKEVMFIDNEIYYKVLNGTKYGYKSLPDEIKPYFESLYKEVKQLKDNWNKLKEHLKENISEERSNEHLWLMGCYDEDKLILEKIEEIEQGSDSNE